MTETVMILLVVIGAVSLLISTTVLGLTAYIVINIFRDNTLIKFHNGGDAQAPVPSASPEEIEAKLKAQRKFEAEQEAFEELMNYSIEQAYGMKAEE